MQTYCIPKFDIADDDTKEEPAPNQGNLFKDEGKSRIIDESRTSHETEITDTALFLDKEDDLLSD